ncbi:SCO family protein [Leptospira sp. 96542]|nr:SCO family protein [Leptospira sp. 96542]
MKYFISFVFLILICAGCSSKEDKIKEIWKDLHFVNPSGEQVKPEFWSQKKSVLYFGFSHCPDMCPLALTNFGRASLILGEKAKNFQFVFISLDPERDSPSTLKNYIQMFPGKQLTAVSPDLETMNHLINLFGLVRKKSNDTEKYMIDHSNFIYVLDKDLSSLGNFPGGTSANVLATKLREMEIP